MQTPKLVRIAHLSYACISFLLLMKGSHYILSYETAALSRRPVTIRCRWPNET